MMNYLFPFITIMVFLSGCVNERGVSMRYYNNCEEYYDVQGSYHKKCGENMIDYSDVKELITPTSSTGQPKVW